MNDIIKQRIDIIRRSAVPAGYRKTKAGILPENWKVQFINDCLERVEKPVSVEMDSMYTQVGIRSHGKGLFHKEPVTGSPWAISQYFGLSQTALF